MSACEVQAVPLRVSRYKQSHVASSAFDKSAIEQSTKPFNNPKRSRVLRFDSAPLVRPWRPCRVSCAGSLVEAVAFIGGKQAAPASVGRPSAVRGNASTTLATVHPQPARQFPTNRATLPTSSPPLLLFHPLRWGRNAALNHRTETKYLRVVCAAPSSAIA